MLIVSGINYLLNNGAIYQKYFSILKNGLVGFTLILLGWLIIRTGIALTGYQNAGGWWRFQCNTESSELQNSKLRNSFFSPAYENLKSFSDPNSFLASSEKRAKISGPIASSDFTDQLNSLG